jgi:RNA polymerase-binding protein DksA
VGEFERRLRRDRGEVWRALATTDAELESLERHQPGEFAEDAANEAVGQMLSRLGTRERRRLEEIEAAQARLAAGRYGTCEGCGQAIGAARLRALPVARLCVGCEEAFEKTA